MMDVQRQLLEAAVIEIEAIHGQQMQDWISRDKALALVKEALGFTEWQAEHRRQEAG